MLKDERWWSLLRSVKLSKPQIISEIKGQCQLNKWIQQYEATACCCCCFATIVAGIAKARVLLPRWVAWCMTESKTCETILSMLWDLGKILHLTNFPHTLPSKCIDRWKAYGYKYAIINLRVIFCTHTDYPDVIDKKIVYWMHYTAVISKKHLNNQNTFAAALDFSYTFAVSTNKLLNSLYLLIISKYALLQSGVIYNANLNFNLSQYLAWNILERCKAEWNPLTLFNFLLGWEDFCLL